jgi:acyl-coenzyme A thioesterase PaaI-like protein
VRSNTVYIGGRLATAEARLTDASGKLYGHATTSCMIFREGKGGRPLGEGEQ